MGRAAWLLLLSCPLPLATRETGTQTVNCPRVGALNAVPEEAGDSLAFQFHFFFSWIFFDNFMYLFILFLIVLGLCCCEGFFSSFSEQGYPLVLVRRLLIAVVSLLAEHGF